jgi:hypothetical protein
LRAISNVITLNTCFDAVKGENGLSMEHRFFSQIRSFAPIYPDFELACSPEQGDPGPLQLEIGILQSLITTYGLNSGVLGIVQGCVSTAHPHLCRFKI